MEGIELKPHEEAFEITPIGVRYRCESCEDGEMRFDPQAMEQEAMLMPMMQVPMFPHVCTKCGAKMKLPRQYPRIEWKPGKVIETCKE